MRIDKDMLEDAGKTGIIPTDSVDDLWRFLAERSGQNASFRPAHIIYYLGGLIAISAMTLFVTLAWEAWAGLPMLVVAVGYAAIGIALTHYFLNREQRVPAGLTIAFAVAMTPLAIYSLQNMLGLWSGNHAVRDYHRYIDWRWLFMELGTLIAAAIALWRYRLPFLVMIVAVTLWYLQMDLVPFLFQDLDYTWELRRLTSIVSGVVFMLLALWIDIRSGRRQDYAFWLYLVGVTTFWVGLTSMESSNELSKFLYFCTNLLLLLIGAVLVRRVFAVFASMGILIYFYHLADKVFHDSLLFPVALAAVGLAIIFCGLYWQRHERRIQAAVLKVMPPKLADLVARAHQSS